MFSTGVYRSATAINSAMGRVYGHMFLAVITSMVVSFAVSSSPGIMAVLFGTSLKWVVMFAPLVAILAVSFAWERFTRAQLQLALHGFAALMGLSMSAVFAVFTLGSIVSAFTGAAVLFALLSGWGYFTKKDLEGWGSYLMIGLIGIIIASVINIFVGNGLAGVVISALSVLIFLGLTAYDTQRIRELVSVDNDGRAEIMGALTLYLDFINLFMSLLQLFGTRKD